MSITVTKEPFGSLPNGDEASLFRIDNGKGITAEIVTVGATIHRLYAPDKDGNLVDVILGQDTAEKYLERSFGAFTGRVANRISGGRYFIGDKEYPTETNAGGYIIHSGSANYARRNFTGEIVDGGVKMSIRDNGEGGFPGGMDASCTYTLDEEGNFKLFYEAMPEEDTPICFTNHVYFNLAGHDAGSVGDHILQMNSDFYLPQEPNSMPTGEVLTVEGTLGMDFREPRTMADGWNSGDPQVKIFEESFETTGYDHNFCIRGNGLRKAGYLKDPKSGRCMDFFTDAPALVLYPATHMRAQMIAKDGATYHHLYGLCIETQNITNAVNLSHLASMIYKAGQKFETTTIYKFYAE